MKKFVSGFIAIVGPTNSGKSTLLNQLAGQKISIVSPKVQTTYRGVSGIIDHPTGQYIFTDTPGYQRHPDRVARLLNTVADQKASACDAALWVFDATNKRVFSQVMSLKNKITELKPQSESICVLNKVDKCSKLELLPLIQSIWELGVFKEVVPISAKTGNGVERLIEIAQTLLPEGTALFPEGTLSDRGLDFLITEAIREKIYRLTHQEVPYSTWIELEEMASENTQENGYENEETDRVRVPTLLVKIHVDSDSKKGILIGKQGERLKQIGIEARKDIEKLLKKQVCLKLHVHVQPRWKEDSKFVNRYLELNS